MLTVAQVMSQQHYNTFQHDRVIFRCVDKLFTAKCIGYSYNQLKVNVQRGGGGTARTNLSAGT